MSDIKVYYSNAENIVPSSNDPATRQFYSDFLLIDRPFDAFGNLEEVQELPVDGLALHYPMTNIDSSILNDAAGSAHLNMSNLEVVPGRNGGQALRFNGTDSFCISSSRILPIEVNTFTLTFWFRTNGLYDESNDRGMCGTFINYGAEGDSKPSYWDGTTNWQLGWNFKNLESSGMLGFSIGGYLDPYEDESNELLQPSHYEDGEWHFAVITFDANYIKTYMDNVLLVNSVNVWNHLRFVDNYRLFLGGRTDLSEYCFYIGDLGEIRFYNRVLSESEIASLYIGT